MIKKIFVFLFPLLLSVTVQCLANSSDGFPNGPGREEELAKIVGEAYVWNHYWYNDWEKNFQKYFEIGMVKTIGICFNGSKNEEEKHYIIFFDGLPSNLSFSKIGNLWYASDVIDDYSDERIPADLKIKKYLNYKSNQPTPIQEFKIVIDKKVLKIIDFGNFNKEKKDFVEAIFLKRFSNDTGFIRNIPKVGILIKVGNFNFKYPFFYYYIENPGKEIQNLGVCQFNTETKEPIFNDLMVPADVPFIKKKYMHVIKRINENGITFRYKDGKFTVAK